MKAIGVLCKCNFHSSFPIIKKLITYTKGLLDER